MYSTFIAYLLWFLSGFGWFGFHRYYLGKFGTGLLWMFSFGMLGFGSFYDFFTLPNQVREANFRQAIIDESIRRKVEAQKAGSIPSWRNVNDGETRIVREKEPVERVILKLAKSNKGILTASELALSANIPMEEAKNALEAMVNKGFAELRVRQSGTIVYAIPDLMSSDEPLVL